jgi:hypothetical protein
VCFQSRRWAPTGSSFGLDDVLAVLPQELAQAGDAG